MSRRKRRSSLFDYSVPDDSEPAQGDTTDGKSQDFLSNNRTRALKQQSENPVPVPLHLWMKNVNLWILQLPRWGTPTS
ncbi:hypothetical protein NC653_010033 [Populus alba x Populus x berolinensis]|uniref:Uncharacterized protein n=1 Tax=Populus alba x Populus x berolinensis TaxID=444605 RepID=A0AAD6RBW7_9ROSI|nr:hypothetical protein NC653_010033 [Populus alba x Populus x berolinensis]